MTAENKTTWPTLRLGDVITLHRGYDLPVGEIQNGSHPVVFSNGKTEYHNKYKVNGPGVVTGRSGTLGNVFYLDKNYWPHNTTLYVSDFKGNDPKYIYYLLKGSKFEKWNAGSGVPTLNRNHVHEMEIAFPVDPREQKQIAETVSVFDEKIENNNKIIKTLEEMAQAIFKEWFICGSIGKEKVVLTELADFVNGGAFGKIMNRNHKGVPLVKIAEFSRGISENTEWIDEDVLDKYKVKNGDLLFSWSGSLELHVWHKGDAVLNQHLFNVIPKKPYTRGFLYVVLKSIMPWFRQIAQSKATSMGHIQRHHLEEQTIFISRDKDLSIFDEIYQKILVTTEENQKLTATRDLLLPKLMSGEIRV